MNLNEYTKADLKAIAYDGSRWNRTKIKNHFPSLAGAMFVFRSVFRVEQRNGVKHIRDIIDWLDDEYFKTVNAEHFKPLGKEIEVIKPDRALEFLESFRTICTNRSVEKFYGEDMAKFDFGYTLATIRQKLKDMN